MSERLRALPPLRRRLLVSAVVASLLFLALNAVAFAHAWSMLHFAARGAKTRKPSELSTIERARVLLTGVNIPKPRNFKTPAEVGLDFSVVSIPSTDGITLEGWWSVAQGRRGVVINLR